MLLLFLLICSAGFSVATTFQECKLLSAEFQQIGEARGVPKPDRYNTSHVKLHITDLQLKKFTHDTEKSFACVDGRKTTATFGAPGGDFGEFMVGLQSYATLINQNNFTRLQVRRILKSYIDYVTTKQRPFYYHTSKVKLIRIFNAVRPIAVILPESTPDNLEDWLYHFVNPNHQGCGHIRMLLTYPEEMGIKHPRLVEFALQSMLEIFWMPGYTEKLFLDVLQGELHPNAVVSVKTEGCPNRDPEIIPNRIGSSIFVHHPDAIDNFRRLKVAKFFESLDSKVTHAAMLEEITKLGKNQLNTVLTRLEPAAEVGTFLVTVKAKEVYGIPVNNIYEVFVGFLTSSFAFGVLSSIMSMVGLTCYFLGRLKKRKYRNSYEELDE